MNTVLDFDSRLFLFLNGLHTDWIDTVMVAITGMWVWMPLYILLIYVAVRQYGWKSIWVFLAVGLVVLCADQLSASVCKPLFHRLRPCYNTDFQGLIYLPKGMAGGHYGFVSSHAANTFAIATFLTFALRKSGWWVGLTLYLWAFISSYSRIYIGYHYPGDILAGALLGLLVGWGIWRLFRWAIRKKSIEID